MKRSCPISNDMPDSAAKRRKGPVKMRLPDMPNQVDPAPSQVVGPVAAVGPIAAEMEPQPRNEAHLPPLPNLVLADDEKVDESTLRFFGKSPFWKGKIANALFGFQKLSVEYALERAGRVYIADTMGLGKTLQAIAIMTHYQEDWPLLVIAPTSLTGNWKAEFLQWLPEVLEDQADKIVIVKTGKQVIPDDSRIVIVPYSLVQPKCDELVARRFKAVIIDECHYGKSKEAGRTKALFRLAGQNAKRVVMLSGTPILSVPSDLYAQLRTLGVMEAMFQTVSQEIDLNIKQGLPVDMHGMECGVKLFKNWTPFTTRYCGGHFDRFRQWNTKGASNKRELFRALARVCMVRRQKEQVLKELPPKTRKALFVELATKDSKAIRTAIEDLRAKAKELMQLDNMDPRTAIRKLMQQGQAKMALFMANAVAKVNPVCDYIEELLNNTDQKFLVFAHHRVLLDSISERLEAYATKVNEPNFFIRIDGTTDGDRSKIAKYFQTNPRCRVAVLSIKAAGVGLTLTAAPEVIFAEMYWNPADMLQAEDRVHRIGQNKPCNITYMIAHDSFDESMWRVLNRKYGMSCQILDGTTDSAKMLTDEMQRDGEHRSTRDEDADEAVHDDTMLDALEDLIRAPTAPVARKRAAPKAKPK